MRICKSLIRAKKSRQDEQKERIRYLEKEVAKLEEVVCEL
jgi:polyhydroxyalkanoate synthesis regulator phasin